MSSHELHTDRSSHEVRKKHRSDSKKERSRSPRHFSSQKRSKRSPSPSKHKSSKHSRERISSPTGHAPLPSDTLTPDSNPPTADNAIVTERTLLLKQKIDERKLKRQRNQSPEDTDIDDVRNWVEHSRQIESKTLETKPSKGRDLKYTSSDLKGMKIGHSLGGFLEGDHNILTLKDKEILDEDTEEILENPTMTDIDRASKNREMRSTRSGDYNPFDDSQAELDSIETALRGERQVGNVLSKYDEEISGQKTHSFHLSENGQLDTSSSLLQDKEKRDSLLAQLGKREIDLNFEHKFGSQVMTSEEIAEKFRKIKKRRKVVTLRAEDLLQQSAPSLPSSDLGSRDRDPSSPIPQFATFRSRKINSDDRIGPASATNHTPISIAPSAEEEDNIASAIERIRRIRESARRHMDPVDRAAAIAYQTEHFKPADHSTDVKPSAMIFDSTQEFVKSLNTQSLPRSSSRLLAELRVDNDNAMEVDSDSEGEREGWKELKNGSEYKSQIKTIEEREDYFEPEPIVSHSLTSTLLLAERKGFIDQVKHKGYTEAVEDPKHKNDISAKNYSLMDKQSRGDQKERTRDTRDDYRDRDRDSFPEMKSYVPEIKLEYVDDLGRDLSQKESFRRMSHIFHGKGSGKLKAERRLKKSEDELSMMKMNSFDTPLNTVAMATRKMESSGIPYLILSGGQHSLETGSVSDPTLAKKRK